MPRRLVPAVDLGLDGANNWPDGDSLPEKGDGRVFEPMLDEEHPPLVRLTLEQLTNGRCSTPDCIISATQHAVLPLLDENGAPIDPAEIAQRKRHLAIISVKEADKVAAMSDKYFNVPIGEWLRHAHSAYSPLFVDVKWLRQKLKEGGLFKALWENPGTEKQEEAYLFRTTGDAKRPTGFVTEAEMEGVEGWEVLAA